MFKNRKMFTIVLVMLGLAAGGVYFYRSSIPSEAQAITENAPATAQAILGDLVITADGSGTLVPGDERELAFGSAGVITELWVEVGDEVIAGDVLARIADDEAQKAVLAAQVQLLQAQLDVAAAETHLLTVQEGPSDSDLLAAEAALASAKDALDALANGPDASELEKVQLSLAQAKNSLWASQLQRDAAGANPDSVQYEAAKASVANAEISVRKAELELEELLEPATGTELAEAEAKLAQAAEALEELTGSPTDDDLSNAEAELEQAGLKLQQAELTLAAAQEDLEGTVLVAPIDGTVMTVDAAVGDEVNGKAILTLADMSQPQVQFWVEEADLNSVVPGNMVNVVFEALPDYTFSGHIISVDPALVTVGSTPAVQVRANIDLSANPVGLLSGMNAEVEVVAGEARNAVLVPIGALRELPSGEYAVMVVASDGEMELRRVEVGLKDFVYAEITSGLQAGETVSTESVGSAASGERSEGTQAPMPDGMMRMMGG